MYVQISELFLAIMCEVCRLVEIIMIIMLQLLLSLLITNYCYVLLQKCLSLPDTTPATPTVMSPAVNWLYVDDDSTTSPHTHYINPSRPIVYYLYHHINMNKFYILPTEFVHVSVSFSQWKVFFFFFFFSFLTFCFFYWTGWVFLWGGV